MQPCRAPLVGDLVEADALGLDERNVPQVQYRDIRAFAWILQREATDDGVTRIRRDVPGFNRLLNDIVNRFAVVEANDQFIERLSELHAFAHRQSPLLLNQALGQDENDQAGVAWLSVVAEAAGRLFEK